MSTIKQISVFLDDRPGTLADLAKVLEQNNVDMRALSVADAKDFGIVRMLVDDDQAAIRTLEEAGYVCMLTDVIAVGVEDTPGGFSAVLQVLGDLDVNIDYSYTLTTHSVGKAYMVARVSDTGRAVRELSERGWQCLKPEDMPRV